METGGKPDLVLIDGRFRVACFAASVLEADPGTVILFDDYGDRPHYHSAKTVLAPEAMYGRMAMFRVPPNIPKAEAQKLLKDFRLITD